MKFMGKFPPELSKSARRQLLASRAYSDYLRWVERGSPLCGPTMGARLRNDVGGLLLMLLPDVVRWLRYGDAPFEAERENVEEQVFCWQHPEACRPS